MYNFLYKLNARIENTNSHDRQDTRIYENSARIVFIIWNLA